MTGCISVRNPVLTSLTLGQIADVNAVVHVLWTVARLVWNPINPISEGVLGTMACRYSMGSEACAPMETEVVSYRRNALIKNES